MPQGCVVGRPDQGHGLPQGAWRCPPWLDDHDTRPDCNPAHSAVSFILLGLPQADTQLKEVGFRRAIWLHQNGKLLIDGALQYHIQTTAAKHPGRCILM